jgi:hypothetical protein
VLLLCLAQGIHASGICGCNRGAAPGRQRTPLT